MRVVEQRTINQPAMPRNRGQAAHAGPAHHVHHERLRAVVRRVRCQNLCLLARNSLLSAKFLSEFSRSVIPHPTTNFFHVAITFLRELCHVHAQHGARDAQRVASLLNKVLVSVRVRSAKQMIYVQHMQALFCNAHKSCAVTKVKWLRCYHVKQCHRVGSARDHKNYRCGSLASARAFCLVFCGESVLFIKVCVYGWHLAPISVRCVCYSYTRKLLSRKKFMNPTFRLHILASGSKGNCSLLETPDGLIMIDCGISRKEILRRSKELNVDLSELVAIFITHEHTDHVAGLSVVSKTFDVPVFATTGTAAVLSRKPCSNVTFTLVDQTGSVHIDAAPDIEVSTFPTSHDVCEPMGMRFDYLAGPDRRIVDSVGYCTDTGILTPKALECLSDVRILAIESNHDEHMLLTGPYPYMLKQRVHGDSGHLSNEYTAQALPQLVGPNTRCVVGMHLSHENNRPSIAVRTLAEAVGAQPLNDAFTEAQTPNGSLAICVASQDWPMSL